MKPSQRSCHDRFPCDYSYDIWIPLTLRIAVVVLRAKRCLQRPGMITAVWIGHTDYTHNLCVMLQAVHDYGMRYQGRRISSDLWIPTLFLVNRFSSVCLTIFSPYLRRGGCRFHAWREIESNDIDCLMNENQDHALVIKRRAGLVPWQEI
jgi:hypothetical protein